MELNKIKKNIKQSEYVSFDIFDTLINRDVVSATDVYKISEHIYCQKYGEAIEGFADKRKEIEEKLWKNTLDGRFTIDFIYKELELFFERETLEKLKEIELFIESQIIEKNMQIETIYRYAIEQNKTILMTSDMYLSGEFLEGLFSKMEINSFYKLFVSGERAAYKVDGSLFDVVIDDLNSKSIIHIGDSKRGDYLMPKTRGLKSIHYIPLCNPYYEKKHVETLADSVLLGMINSHSIEDGNYWNGIGYSILGPLLIGYVKWIEKNAREQGIKKIVFLARDGYIVKEIFDLFYKDMYETEYMYISRKSALIPTIESESSIREILSIFKFRRKENFSDVLHRLGVSAGNENDKLDFEVKREDLYAGKYDDVLDGYKQEIIKKANEQRTLLLKYCESIFTEDKVAVVDIGWHGSIQTALKELLGNKVKLIGLYLGLEKQEEVDKKAYFSKSVYFDANMIPFTRGVYETFFSATHASTEGYTIVDDKVVPMFSECDMSRETTDKINCIQEGAICFADKYQSLTNNLMLENEKVSSNLLASGIVNFTINPTHEDVVRFGDIEFNDTTNRKLIDYDKRKIKTNIKAFLSSDWKAGYAQRLFKKRIGAGKLMTKVNRLRKRD